MYEKKGFNIPLGQGVLGLANACDGSATFQIPLYDRGLEVGSLSGKVQITNLASVKSELVKLSLPS